MAMPQVAKWWTREEVLALPDDGNRYELIDGELLVSPSPRPLHQVAVWELYSLVFGYVDSHGIGIAGMAPADLALGSAQVVQPDVFVVAVDRARIPRAWEDFPVPMLAAEVLSSSTAARDRGIKRRRYLESGVAVYWVVDLEARRFEEWRAGAERPTMHHQTVGWQPDSRLPPLTIDLHRYFRRVHGA